MANILSSQKKNRQRITHEARNRSHKAAMRTAIKKVRTAISAKDPAKAKAALGPAIRLVDRLGRKGVIKQNAASRAVSRLTRAANSVSASK